jgi:hypothetical protein
MLKRLWRTWTVDRPAAFGDLLWDVFVVQFAAWLDRLTLRRIVAFIPVVILVLAYAHRIPIPPELMLVGDLMAYVDVFSVLFLFGVLSRVATIVFVLKQVAARARELTRFACEHMRRLDVRNRRARSAPRRERPTGRSEDGEYPGLAGLARA